MGGRALSDRALLEREHLVHRLEDLPILPLAIGGRRDLAYALQS